MFNSGVKDKSVEQKKKKNSIFNNRKEGVKKVLKKVVFFTFPLYGIFSLVQAKRYFWSKEI